MPVFSIWESRFPREHVARGRAVTEAIWQEMPIFPGYLRHALIEDLDDPGHLSSLANGRAAKLRTRC
jgi:hypothetical protein